MKLTEFAALCDREWSKPKRGDVFSLCLTEAGYQELAGDMAVDREQAFAPLVPLIDKADLAAIREGRMRVILNPITRTQVKVTVKQDAKRETARAQVMGGTCRSTWWAAGAADRH